MAVSAIIKLPQTKAVVVKKREREKERKGRKLGKAS